MDLLMKGPSTEERGKKIAKLMNDLDFVNDCAMHFGLGLSFKQIKNRRAKLVK
jgi:hypothetical protein